MNSMYTLEVHSKNHKPVFVAAFKSPVLVGVHFFNTLKEANAYIQKERERLEVYGYDLRYDCDDFVMDEKMYAVVREVMENDDIAIGSEGRTYSKKLFPNGI